jgi:hypothetical protein
MVARRGEDVAAAHRRLHTTCCTRDPLPGPRSEETTMVARRGEDVEAAHRRLHTTCCTRDPRPGPRSDTRAVRGGD